MHNHTEVSINSSVSFVEEKFKNIINEKDKQIKEFMKKNNEVRKTVVFFLLYLNSSFHRKKNK